MTQGGLTNSGTSRTSDLRLAQARLGVNASGIEAELRQFADAIKKMSPQQLRRLSEELNPNNRTQSCGNCGQQGSGGNTKEGGDLTRGELERGERDRARRAMARLNEKLQEELNQRGVAQFKQMLARALRALAESDPQAFQIASANPTVQSALGTTDFSALTSAGDVGNVSAGGLN